MKRKIYYRKRPFFNTLFFILCLSISLPHSYCSSPVGFNSNENFAQMMPPAMLTDDRQIMLDSNSPLSSVYVADASTYRPAFSNQSEGQIYLEQMFNKDYISLSYDYNSNQMTINLDLTHLTTKDWTLQDWKNHLEAED